MSTVVIGGSLAGGWIARLVVTIAFPYLLEETAITAQFKMENFAHPIRSSIWVND